MDNEELTFTLNDGSYIISKSGSHQRVENGYKIEGKMRQAPIDHWNSLNSPRPDSLFIGIVLDKQIKEITYPKLKEVTISKYDGTLTWIAGVGGFLVGAFVALGIGFLASGYTPP